MFDKYQAKLLEVKKVEDLQPILNLLCQLLPNCFGAITFREHNNLVCLDQDILDYTIVANLGDQDVQVYDVEHRDDDTLAKVEIEQGRGIIVLGQDKFESYLDVFPQSAFQKSKFYNEFLLRLGVDDSIVLNLFSAGSYVVRLNLYFKSHRKTLEKALVYLNGLVPLFKLAMKYVYLNDPEFKDIIKSKQIKNLLCQQYKELQPNHLDALYLLAIQKGSEATIALKNGFEPKEFNRVFQNAKEIINSQSKDTFLSSRDSVIRFISEIEEEVSSAFHSQ